MKNSIVLIVAVFAVGLAVLFGQEKGEKKSKHSKKPKAGVISYKKNVFPIIKKYCLPCHAEEEMNPSGLHLDSYEDMMEGGKHGPPIIGGNADSSLVINKISSAPPFGDPMPVRRKTPFPADTLKIIKKWIEQGAKDN